ncbi:DsbA family protein [Salarchaeum sp. JOR-1]|uniref:DsbA family oxidoreductase n=1 Tax=Salarchaeum sp. JOR-1 TaxID=2599399 RepID=UPI001198BC9B|nr:DsbA family protein [Salarchaeum sp. JOR-1]QDX39873.1 disulfide bond formation protein DsbA [Salarchaeum sp. JOR-1]
MSDIVPEDTLAVYSDFVCPFCYLGRASLQAYLDRSDDPPAVDWRFFDLRGYKRGPDGDIDDSVEDGKDEDYFANVKDNVERLKEEYGADEMLGLDDVPDVDSWDAQQAALYVKQSYDDETFQEFYNALFDTHWVDGRPIDDPDVLADVAASVGVDGDEIRDAITDETLEAELEDRFEDATDVGITGIPTFVYGEHAARGSVPPEQLERLVSGR